MAVRRSSQGSSPKAGATSPQARAAAYGDRLSQLEKDMPEIRDGMINKVLEKLQLLSYEIEEINRRFDTVDRTCNILDGLRVRVDCYENEMADLRRQVERDSAPLPSQNQQAGTDRFPIPMYSGERNSLSRFLKHFYTWALSSQSEDALSHSCPAIMTGDKSRRELEREYGRHIVAKSLTVWNGLTKAVEKDKSIADIVVRAKAPSEAWKILKSMVEDESSDRARELAKKQFEELSMNDDESMKEYIARAKSLALNVKYHNVEVTDQEISRRVLNGLPPSYAPEKRNFALKTDFSLAELEGGLVRVEELSRSPDGTDGNHALVAGFKARKGGRSGDVEATIAADAASATVKVARRINGSRNISGGISESSSPRISRNNSSISRGTSNISNRSRDSSTRDVSRDISRSSPHSMQGDGAHHAFVSGVVNTGIFCRSAVQYPPRVLLTRTRARKLRLIHILKTTPIWGAALHHHSQSARRRTCMDRTFRPSHPETPPVNWPPWRNLRHQASFMYRMKTW